MARVDQETRDTRRRLGRTTLVARVLAGLAQPGRLRPGYTPTARTLPSDLDAEQMYDYLSYCSELFSLIGKTAALCAEHSTDGTVLDTVSDIETLATELSSTVYQKMAMIHRLDPR